MIPGYVKESKCVKLCSLSFSLFKKIKFKMAKILGDAMGIYKDFAHFSGFQLEKRLNLGGVWRGEVTGGYFAKRRMENLYWFYSI